jgi:hypothetical protein
MAETAAPKRSPATRPAPGSGRRTLFLIAALALAPIVASYVVYYGFPRPPGVNYGTLLPTRPAPAIDGTRADGSSFGLGDLRGRWVLLATGRGDCDPVCERGLYATRQARTMQGKDQERVVRVWLVAGEAAPAGALLARHPDLVAARVAPAALDALPGGAGPIYLVDPLGNLVLRYPADPDIRGIANDLTRLLKASRIG